MSTTSQPVHAVLNWEREEVRVPAPLGETLLTYLVRHGLHGHIHTDTAGDVITLDGEPDMGRVRRTLDEWEHGTDPSVT
jgi:hypothetical protein